jgi:lipoprotein-anchoring transpeptidase ErfK/SrfK
VPLPTLRQATDDVAREWHRPVAADASQGWWVSMKPANVRVAPSTDAPRLGEFKGGESVKVLSEVAGAEFKGDPTWYRIDGGRYPGGFVHASLVQRKAEPKPTLAPPPDDRPTADQPWLVVDRATHTLTMLKNGQPEFVTYVALGKAGKDTLDGTYPTFLKYIADRMTSASVPDAERSYNLPNVPYPMYFKDDGSALHGTYWHDAFGTDESQGCINVTWGDSEYLFQHTLPTIGDGQVRVAAPPEQATQLIIVH